jgi:hypothetical protein
VLPAHEFAPVRLSKFAGQPQVYRRLIRLLCFVVNVANSLYHKFQECGLQGSVSPEPSALYSLHWQCWWLCNC